MQNAIFEFVVVFLKNEFSLLRKIGEQIFVKMVRENFINC